MAGSRWAPPVYPRNTRVHRASLNSQRRVLTGEIGCRRARRQTLLPRWSAAADARKLTRGRQWVEDVAVTCRPRARTLPSPARWQAAGCFSSSPEGRQLLFGSYEIPARQIHEIKPIVSRQAVRPGHFEPPPLESQRGRRVEGGVDRDELVEAVHGELPPDGLGGDHQAQLGAVDSGTLVGARHGSRAGVLA